MEILKDRKSPQVEGEIPPTTGEIQGGLGEFHNGTGPGLGWKYSPTTKTLFSRPAVEPQIDSQT